MSAKEFLNLVNNVVADPYKHSTVQGSTILIEEGVSKVQLERSGMCLVFRFDAVKGVGSTPLFPFFNCRNNKDLCKMCDYVLFSKDDADNINILVAELKSGKIDGGLEQLRAGSTFLNFLLDSVYRLNGNPGVSKEQIKIKGVIFSTKASKIDTKARLLKYFQTDSKSGLEYKIVGYQDYKLENFFV